MDHKKAIRTNAVDRYLLGELSTAERQEFEEHFFACGECSEDLHVGAILVNNSRAILREEFLDPVPASPGATPHRPGWSLRWSHLPMAASIALAALVGYQNLKVIPEYRREMAANVGAVAPLHFDLRPAVRGAVPTVLLSKGTRFFELGAEEVDPAAGGYECAIQDAKGGIRARFRAPSVQSGDPLSVLLDTRQIAPGQYMLVVRRTADGEEIGRYPFSLEIE
jgi:hypothetical protein